MRTSDKRSRGRRNSERGNNLLEFGLVTPLLLSVLLVLSDAGVYVYSFISIQNAARSAATKNSGGHESASDQSSACSTAIQQLQGLPSIGGLAGGSCASAPLVVTSVLCEASGACGNTAGSADQTESALVTIKYTLPPLFQIPLAGPAVISISSQMKLRDVQ